MNVPLTFYDLDILWQVYCGSLSRRWHTSLSRSFQCVPNYPEVYNEALPQSYFIFSYIALLKFLESTSEFDQSKSSTGGMAPPTTLRHRIVLL